MNPGNIGGRNYFSNELLIKVSGSKEKKEVAKPYTKIQTTINERNTTGGTKPTKAATDIWSVDEVKDIVVDKKENRLEPEYEVRIKIILTNLLDFVQTKSWRRRCLFRNV